MDAARFAGEADPGLGRRNPWTARVAVVVAVEAQLDDVPERHTEDEDEFSGYSRTLERWRRRSSVTR